MFKSLSIERFFPAFAGISALVIWYYWGFSFKINYIKELLAGAITASAIGAGFMATALSILLSISNTESGKILKNSKYSKIFYRYVRSCFYACLILACLCIIAFPILDVENGLNIYYSSILFGFSVYTISSFIRITEILLNIFENT
ncbi:hypothetical protein [Comamonas terrigena]|uniref:hypothetical protein n=1 Tax=Comamonas terrigena TaxID=32013 RepID=UPI0028AEF699|nr:hypothetical protein [Comamonas terrigena]